MKKIFVQIGITLSLFFAAAAPAFAVAGAKTSMSPDPVCMQSAIEKRDSGIIAAVENYAVSVKLGLTSRKDGLKAAWNQMDKKQRSSAIKLAWSAFSGTWKKANAALQASRKSAWSQYERDRKACGSKQTEDGDKPMSTSGL